MSDILIDMKKNHSLMFKVLEFIYLNLQIDLFMIAFALVFDFKQIQCCMYSRHIVYFFFL